LLSRVSGIGEGLARSIVSYRQAHGSSRTRVVLKKVPRFGPKAFELSAGFLRIANGDDPLDASGVHPEAYPVVRRILAATKSELKRLIGDTSVLRQLEPEAFTDAIFGVPTVSDILQELEKPGRDPRPAFKTALLPGPRSPRRRLPIKIIRTATSSAKSARNFGRRTPARWLRVQSAHRAPAGFSCQCGNHDEDPREP
jgi:hypothetical protein